MRIRLIVFLMIPSVSFAGNKGFKGKRTYDIVGKVTPQTLDDDLEGIDFENLNFEPHTLPPKPKHLRTTPTEAEQALPKVEIVQDESELPPIEDRIPLAVDAALKNDRDPEYIRDIFSRVLSKKVHKFFREKNIQSPRQLLAFYMTLGAFSETVFGHKSVYGEIARQVARTIVQRNTDISPTNVIWKQVSETVAHACPSKFKAIWDTVQKTYIEKFKDSGDTPISETKPYQFAYKAASDAWNPEAYFHDIFIVTGRVTELRALYIMLEHAETILEESYTNAIHEIPTRDLEGNPFASTEEWLQFRKTHFDELTSNTFFYIKPWVDLLNSYMLTDPHGTDDTKILSKLVIEISQ